MLSRAGRAWRERTASRARRALRATRLWPVTRNTLVDRRAAIQLQPSAPVRPGATEPYYSALALVLTRLASTVADEPVTRGALPTPAASSAWDDLYIRALRRETYTPMLQGQGLRRVSAHAGIASQRLFCDGLDLRPVPGHPRSLLDSSCLLECRSPRSFGSFTRRHCAGMLVPDTLDQSRRLANLVVIPRLHSATMTFAIG